MLEPARLAEASASHGEVLGVEKDHVVQVVALSMLYLGDIATDGTVRDLEGVLEEWEL